MRHPIHATHFGFKFLDTTSDGRVHPGYDYNNSEWNPEASYSHADLGMPVYPMTDGEVVYSKFIASTKRKMADGTTKKIGWGNLVVIYHPTISMWTRYGHLQDLPVKIGDKVFESESFARLGNTGTHFPHVHADLIKKNLGEEFGSWAKYTGSPSSPWNKEKVLEYYEDMVTFIDNYNDISPQDRRKMERVESNNSRMWLLLDTVKQTEEVKKAKDYLHESNEELRKVL